MITKPGFYDKFTCIGSACDFTCCQEWKIAVDKKTASEWRNTAVPKECQLDQKMLYQLTEIKDDSRVIALNEHNKCPFLNREGLCHLVIRYGDRILSETCQIFPREKHEYENVTELSMMSCCPAVIDLYAYEEAPMIIIDTKQSDTQNRDCEDDRKRSDDKKLENQKETDRRKNVRSYLMDLCTYFAGNLGEGLTASFFLLGEFEKNESLTIDEAEQSRKEILSLIRNMGIRTEDTFAEDLELFLDLSENYRKQGLYDLFLDDASYYAEVILQSLTEDSGTDDGAENTADGARNRWLTLYENNFKQQWRRFQKLFRNWIYYEIHADLMQPDSEFGDLGIHLQWIALEYVFMRTWCFLHFVQTHHLEYEDVRSSIVLASRMMGYEEADIWEYLENSFESLSWDIGYFAMIVHDII